MSIGSESNRIEIPFLPKRIPSCLFFLSPPLFISNLMLHCSRHCFSVAQPVSYRILFRLLAEGCLRISGCFHIVGVCHRGPFIGTLFVPIVGIRAKVSSCVVFGDSKGQIFIAERLVRSFLRYFSFLGFFVLCIWLGSSNEYKHEGEF